MTHEEEAPPDPSSYSPHEDPPTEPDPPPWEGIQGQCPPPTSPTIRQRPGPRRRRTDSNE